MKERSLILIKPDGVQRGLIGEIISRFEKIGLKLVGMKMISPDEKHYHKHYEGIGKMISRRGEDTFKAALKFMQSGPVVAVVLEGVDAVSVIRKIVGTTEPKSANPGTIRGDYAHMNYSYADEKKIGIPNLIHASGDPSEAKLEIDHWFKKNELFYSYSTVHEKFM